MKNINIRKFQGRISDIRPSEYSDFPELEWGSWEVRLGSSLPEYRTVTFDDGSVKLLNSMLNRYEQVSVPFRHVDTHKGNMDCLKVIQRVLYYYIDIGDYHEADVMYLDAISFDSVEEMAYDMIRFIFKSGITDWYDEPLSSGCLSNKLANTKVLDGLTIAEYIDLANRTWRECVRNQEHKISLGGEGLSPDLLRVSFINRMTINWS